jgi:hypothetical protein
MVQSTEKVVLLKKVWLKKLTMQDSGYKQATLYPHISEKLEGIIQT